MDINAIKTFATKAAIVVFAALLFVVGTTTYVKIVLEERLSKISTVELWKKLESNIGAMAARPMDKEKKEKILKDLRVLASEYRPFIDVLNEGKSCQ